MHPSQADRTPRDGTHKAGRCTGQGIIVGIVGPTATGKSDLAVDLALTVGAEVVNADAFALYRGMDIGTAKASYSARTRVPHHQLDVLDIVDEASVAAYQRAARRDLDDIAGRAAVPILVGGSGLYVRAALDVLDIPPTDPRVRQRLEHEARTVGIEQLRARLERLDPVAAAAIQGANTRRVVRALEVIELTGQPFSATMPRREFRKPSCLIGLDLPTAELDERIEQRVRAMWDAGFCDEVAQLAQQGLFTTRTAWRAVGYREAHSQICGELTQQEAMAATVTATRRLARRQRSWFRADPRITWLDASIENHTSGGVLAGARAVLAQAVLAQTDQHADQ